MNVMLQTILAKPSSQRTPAPPPGLRAWKQKNIGKSSSFFLSYSKLFNTFQFQRRLFATSLVCRFDAAVVAVVLVVSLPWKQALEKREARQSKRWHDFKTPHLQTHRCSTRQSRAAMWFAWSLQCFSHSSHFSTVLKKSLVALSGKT